MLLTNSEIMNINQNAEFDSAIGYARAIESAVLEKLKAQEAEKRLLNFSCQLCLDTGFLPKAAILPEPPDIKCPNGCRPNTHPLPPDDVVRDAARYKWLRERVGVLNDGYYRPWMPVGNSKIEHVDKLETDRAVDAAMEKMK